MYLDTKFRHVLTTLCCEIQRIYLYLKLAISQLDVVNTTEPIVERSFPYKTTRNLHEDEFRKVSMR